MERYKIISFIGLLSNEQSDETKKALETHEIYKEYITEGAVVIILKLKENPNIITIKTPEKQFFWQRNITNAL